MNIIYDFILGMYREQITTPGLQFDKILGTHVYVVASEPDVIYDPILGRLRRGN
jgi:hypothetical protein